MIDLSPRIAELKAQEQNAEASVVQLQQAAQEETRHILEIRGSIKEAERMQGIFIDLEKAAAKKDKMLTNLTAAVNSGKWEAGLKRVSLEDWKRAARDIGVNRIAAGIDGAKSKVIAFAEVLLPHIDRGLDKIKSMPDVTLDDNINRMTSFIRHMSELKRT